VIGGSGNGEAIAANKVRGVRAALVWSDETARLGREHNNANVVSLGARQYPEADALRFAEIFLATDFTGEERHVRRLAMLENYERTGQVPPA
jgi:ribose 5-phosphate isomerase B